MAAPIPSKSEVKELSSIERELSIVIPSDAVKMEMDRAYQRLSQNVRLKGFRQGKVPRQVLEQYYRADVEKEVLNKLLGNGYKEAVTAHSLMPISEPSIEATSPFALGSDFSFKAKVEVKPKITLKKWQGLEFETPVFNVGEKDVDFELEGLRASHSTIVPVTDRDTVLQGDLVECSYSGTIDGHHKKTLSGLSQTIEVGSGAFFKEAEQALVGKKITDRFEIDVDVADNHADESLRGKTARLSVSVEGIKARKMPDLDDEFAKDISDRFETLQDLKTSIMASLTEQKTHREEDEKKNAAIVALIDANPFDVPASLVERQAEFTASRALAQMPREQAEQIWQKIGEQLKDEAKPMATKTVQVSLLCETIFKEQNLAVTDDDIENELEHEAARLNVTKQRLRAYYKPDDIEQMKYRLANEKALSLVMDNAKIKTLEKSFRE